MPEMRITFYLLLMLTVACFSDEQNFETKTIRVGENIKLICTRRDVGTLFWIKLVSENFPKILGRSFGSQNNDQRIRTATEPETFALYITKAQESDTGVYICMKITNRDLKLLNGTSLKVEDPVFSTKPPSDLVRLEHKVTLQCSVLRDFQNKTCPTETRMFCLSTKSKQSELKYTYVNGGDDHENNSERLATKKCVYSCFRNFSTSDFQAYYCSQTVATCVESGDKAKGNTEALDKSVSKKKTIFLYLLSAALAISLTVVASLIYSINKLKKKSHVDCNAIVALQTNIISRAHQENQQTDEDELIYSTPTFKKVCTSGKADAKPREEESIYAGVKAPVLD